MEPANTPAIRISSDGHYVVTTPLELYHIPTKSNLRVDARANALVCDPLDSTSETTYPFERDGGVSAKDVFDQIAALKTPKQHAVTPPKIFVGVMAVFAGAVLVALGGDFLLTQQARVSAHTPISEPEQRQAGQFASAENVPTRLTGIAKPDLPPSASATVRKDADSTDATGELAPTKMKVVPGDRELPNSFAIKRVPQ